MAMIATTGAEPLRLGQPRLRHPYENVIEGVSSALLGLPCLVPEGGDWREPAPEASIRLDHACWVLLAVHDLGAWSCPDGWSELPHGLVWRFAGSMRYRADRIIARRCSAGELALPANRQQHRRGFWARPHMILLSDVLPDPPSPHETCDGLLAALTRVETIELRAGRLSASISTRPMLRLLAFADGLNPEGLARRGHFQRHFSGQQQVEEARFVSFTEYELIGMKADLGCQGRQFIVVLGRQALKEWMVFD